MVEITWDDGKKESIDDKNIVAGIKRDTPPSFLQRLGQVAKDVGGGIVGGAASLGPNIAGAIMKGGEYIAGGMNRIDQAMGMNPKPVALGQELINRGQSVQNIAENKIGARPDAIGTQLGRMVAPLAASVVGANSLGITKAGAGLYNTVKGGVASGNIPAVLKGIAGSAGLGGAGQAMYDISAEGKTTPSSIAVGGAVVGAVASLPVLQKVVSNIGGGIYNFAFKQAQQKYLNQSAIQFGKKAGDLVGDEGLKARSLKDAGKEVKSKLGLTWDALKNQASKAGDLDVATLNTTMKTDLKGKMLKGLQKNTKFYNSISNNVDDLVNFYIGKKGKIAGDKVIDLVKELNTQLPSGAFKKSELALSKAKTTTLIKGFKGGLQKYLDGEVGDITRLYGDYSRQKLVSDILSDVQVKKMLGRSLLGATVGGVGAGGSDIASGNIGEGLKKAVIGAMIGGLITKTSTDPAFLYKMGRLLR